MTITAPAPSWTVRAEITINMNRGHSPFTAIQDETHRFANAYRKQQMEEELFLHPDRGARGGPKSGQGPDDSSKCGCCGKQEATPTSWKIPRR